MSKQPFVITFSLTCGWWIGPNGSSIGWPGLQILNKSELSSDTNSSKLSSVPLIVSAAQSFSPREPSTPTLSNRVRRTATPQPISNYITTSEVFRKNWVLN